MSFEIPLPPDTKMKGLSAFPQISWLATGSIWVSPLCVGACLWAGQLKGTGGWPFCVLLLISREAAPPAWLERSRAFGSDRWRAGSFLKRIEHTHPTGRLAWPQPLLWELTLVPDRQLGNSFFVFFLMDRGDERSTLVNDGKQAGRLLWSIKDLFFFTLHSG